MENIEIMRADFTEKGAGYTVEYHSGENLITINDVINNVDIRLHMTEKNKDINVTSLILNGVLSEMEDTKKFVEKLSDAILIQTVEISSPDNKSFSELIDYVPKNNMDDFAIENRTDRVDYLPDSIRYLNKETKEHVHFTDDSPVNIFDSNSLKVMDDIFDSFKEKNLTVDYPNLEYLVNAKIHGMNKADVNKDIDI